MPSRARLPGLSVALCGVAALALYGWYDWADPRRPGAADLTQGWWAFSDQGRYLTSTLAWAAGDLRPSQHWYLPGYSLLGVPFVRLTPSNPFLLPDAALLLASLWLTAGVAAELAPGWRWARAAGAAAFLAALANPAALEIWVTPWTTTPAAALILGCLLSLLRFLRRGSWRTMLAASACAGCLVAIRPSDAALLGGATLTTGVARLATAWPGWRTGLRIVLAAAVGVAAPALATGLLYLWVNGLRLNPYLAYSAALGFEWQLLPLQWVTLVLDPQPMLPSGSGLLPAFPFIATGLAGMAACVVWPPGGGRRAAHGVVACTAIAYGALYLCYRDLHPPGLWIYYNYHYFKWLLPIFALYTVLLASVLLRPVCLFTAASVLVAVLPWRARLEVLPGSAQPAAAGRRLELPDGLRVGTALVAAATGTFDSIYNGANNFYFGAHWYGAAGSVAAYPIPGGLLLAPLRPLHPGPGYVVLDPSTSVDPAFEPRVAAMRLRYGWPCYLPRWLHDDPSCHSAGPIPPPARAPGQPIVFDATAAPLLVSGWQPSGPDAMWTVGDRAALRLRVHPPPEGAVLAVDASAFVLPGSPALDVAVRVGGVIRGRWRFGDAAPEVLHVALPAGSFGPDGLLDVELLIANPRRPSDWTGSKDTRLLGLLVRSITVDAAPQ